MHMMIVVLQTWAGLIVLIMLVVRFASLCQFFSHFFLRSSSNIKILSSHFYVKQIRAGHLSGDCHYKRELLRGFMKLRGHEQVSLLYSLNN